MPPDLSTLIHHLPDPETYGSDGCPLNRSGVYALKDGDKPIYVGQSTQLGQRVRTHARDKSFDRVDFWPCRDRSDRLRLETILVMIHLPPLNKGIALGTDGTKVWEIRWKGGGRRG